MTIDDTLADRARRGARNLSDFDLRRTLSEDRASLAAEAVRALEEEVRRRELRVHPWPNQNYLPICTIPRIDGYVVTEILGVVGAEVVLGVGLFREVVAGITDVVGGRSTALQSELRKAREACIGDLGGEAERLRADAVIGVTTQLSEFGGQGKSMVLMQATGTAVRLEPGTPGGSGIRSDPTT